LDGKVGIWKQARELVITSEPKSTALLILPADKITQGDTPLGFIQTLLRSRLSRMLHGRHIKDGRTEIRVRNFSLDSRSHQTGDAAFNSAKPHDLQHPRANTDSRNSHNTQHARANKIQFALCKRKLSPARHVIENKSHQTRAKSMRVLPLCLWGI
jgi:hypothetical protein